MPVSREFERRVFLNIPYDKRFQHLYLAYIVGLANLELTPVVTLQIATGETRVDRIYDLVRSCRYSIHDLSWVRSGGTPRLPRFNMPFELGLAVSWARQSPRKHSWILFDSVRYEAHRTLSDIAGSDFNIHSNTVRGVFSGLCSAFVLKAQPKVPKMLRDLNIIQAALPALKKTCGTTNLFEARIFSELVVAARNIASTR